MSDKTKEVSSLPLASSLVTLMGLTEDGTLSRLKRLTSGYPTGMDLNNVTSPGLYRYTSGILHRPHMFGVAIVIKIDSHLMMIGFSQTGCSNMIALRYLNGASQTWTKWLNHAGAEITEINS